ncbi:alpha-amylase family glycosyl hydrolase [Corallincola spongiicola]|uniref:DUF3459 domain-containing protein n=1 Tax=Corallincola spongiicola TaxID=2520508 RepID=A0ABY1WUC2_9GAMM|nr:alpha-amylase family glycosyl hydrolase [Corallincola spongiicola]TAA48344.1 DUF3459 domain-containing protein [Corallincola spongiicola]
MNTKFSLSAIAAAMLLSACGGSSSGNPDPTPTPSDGTAEVLMDMSVVAVDDQPAMPAGWHEGAVFAEIYVRSYMDSDGDGIGDFQGLTSKLDYLQELGVEGIWLLPINESSDNDHGYEVENYRTMETDYGTREDFDEFLAQAHARGIGVIMDYVINHSSGANPLFLDSDNSVGDKRDWYVWSETNPVEEEDGWIGYWGPGWHPGQNGGFYYGIFQHYMPDFNLHNQDVIDFHHNNLRYWLNAGLDGFRFDAVGQLFENGPGHEGQTNQPENMDVLFGLQQLIMEDYSNRYIVCENPANVGDTNGPQGCGSAFAFGLNYQIMSTVINRSTDQYLAGYLSYDRLNEAGIILANHDEFAGHRVYEQLNGNIDKYKLAAATLLTLPGRPFIYYGEEIGMGHTAGATNDHALRAPMSWTAEGGFTEAAEPFRNHAGNVADFNVETAEADPDSLLNHYKTLIQLRKDTPALRYGSISVLKDDEVLAYTREHQGNSVLVILNLSTADVNVNLDLGGQETELTPLAGFGESPLTTSEYGELTTNLQPNSIGIYSY